MKVCLQSLVFVCFLIASLNLYAAEVGTVEKIKGKVFALSESRSAGEKGVINKRRLKQGGLIYVGERIQTARRSFVALRFTDNTMFALGASSEMVIDSYAFSKSGKGDSIFTRVTKGAFRFISGLISKRNQKAMGVRLGTVATIGIRGTHVGGQVVPRQGDKDASAEVLLLEPELAGRKTAIEVFNDFGAVYIDQPGYGTDIPDEKSPPSPARKMQIRTVNNMLRAIRKASVPKTIR